MHRADDEQAPCQAQPSAATLADFRAFELIDEPALLLHIDQGRVCWANRAAIDMLRLDLSDGASSWPPPSRLSELRARYHQLAAAGLDGESDPTFLPRPNGGVFECKLRAVRLDDVTPALFVRVPDSSRRVDPSAAAELARLQDFVDSGSGWTWETDVDHRFTYVSQGVATAIGRTRAELIGRTREEIAAAEGRPEGTDDLLLIRRSMEARLPFSKAMLSLRRRDGGLCHALISGVPVFDKLGAFSGYRGSAEDVSELVDAERRHAASKQRFRDFAEVASDWFWELDRELRFTFVSPGTADRTGEDAQSLLGRTPSKAGLQGVSDEAWAAHLADLQAHRPIVDFRFGRVDGEGKLRQFSVSAKPIYGPTGEFAGYRGTGREITELIDARRFLREVIDAVPAVVAVRDLAGRYLLVNRAYATLCGDEPANFIGQRVGIYFGEESGREVHARDLEAARADRPTPPTEMKVRSRGDGQEHDWLTQKVPLHDSAGRVVGVLTHGTNITLLKDAQAALVVAQDKLRDSEQRFRDYAETASDWFWEQDENLRFTFISSGNRRLSNMEAHEHYGKTRRETGPLDVSEEQWARHEADLAARRPFVEFRITRLGPDGRKRYLTLSGKPIFGADGQFKGYRGSGRDLTALVEAEQRFRDFAEAGAHVTWEMDKDLRITFISDSVEAVTGDPPSSFIGRDQDDFVTADPSRESLRQVLEQRQAFRDFPFSRLHRDGRTIHLMYSAKPVLGPGGEFLGYRGTTRDVTRQRAMEQEAQRLRQAHDLAAAADMAKSRFLAHMSHELRTPLNAILGMSEIISTEVFGPVGVPAYRDYAKDIMSSGQHLLAIINDLLDRSRIELGQFNLSPEPVDAGTLADEALRIGRGVVSSAGPRIELESATAAGCSLQVDRRAIRQVLINLLSNAAKFTPPEGRIVLAINALPSGELSFSVTDTGSGIEPERIDHIFEPFQHGNAHQARKGQGAGLGLWLSRALMELHGGSLVLQSVVGQGTKAIATLPAERVASRQSSATKT